MHLPATACPGDQVVYNLTTGELQGIPWGALVPCGYGLIQNAVVVCRWPDA